VRAPLTSDQVGEKLAHYFSSTVARDRSAHGMRLSEAFEIDGEKKERGCRYVIVSHKTPQSHHHKCTGL
jgi:hypothetical protein